MCVRHSIFYVCATCCDLDVTISLSETAREKARGNNNDLWGGGGLDISEDKKEEEKRMYLRWNSCTLYLHACQVRVTVGDTGLCCCTCVTYFEW